MHWVLSCAGGDKTPLGATARMSGTAPWNDFEFYFAVPDTPGCEAQLLQLQLAARIAPEQQISGGIWYDSLRIEKMNTSAAAE
jgi:hypothetical protein